MSLVSASLKQFNSFNNRHTSLLHQTGSESSNPLHLANPLKHKGHAHASASDVAGSRHTHRSMARNAENSFRTLPNHTSMQQRSVSATVTGLTGQKLDNPSIHRQLFDFLPQHNSSEFLTSPVDEQEAELGIDLNSSFYSSSGNKVVFGERQLFRTASIPMYRICLWTGDGNRIIAG